MASSYLTNDYKSCEELCNLKGEGQLFYEDTDFEKNADDYKKVIGEEKAEE